MDAPGGPGAPPMWGPGRKMAFGTAPGSRSKVWYALAGGSLSEVFFPFLDHVALHELRFFVSAGGAPPVDDSADGQHAISWLSPGVPAFKVETTHHEYRLAKEIFSDPEENSLLIAATFTPELPDLRLYMQASAHWEPGTEGNFGSVIDTHPPALLLQQQDVWICFVGPFARATVGYFRSSDVHIDLDDGALARASFALLHCLEDKSHAGAFIASPSAPWGEQNHDGNHVYHLVWPRDLCRIATALLDAGDTDAALRAFRHLQLHQRADGGWHQNWKLDGTPHWQSNELDQVALPILLAWRLGVAGWLDHDPYSTMVRPAGQFIIREGPLTPLDRWEDAGGLSPSTLAACIAALIVAAEFAGDAGEHVAAHHFRAVADYWNDRIESWCSTPSGQYVRLASDPDRRPEDGAVGPEVLELVRCGLRRPEDARGLGRLQ